MRRVEPIHGRLVARRHKPQPCVKRRNTVFKTTKSGFRSRTAKGPCGHSTRSRLAGGAATMTGHRFATRAPSPAGNVPASGSAGVAVRPIRWTRPAGEDQAAGRGWQAGRRVGRALRLVAGSPKPRRPPLRRGIQRPWQDDCGAVRSALERAIFIRRALYMSRKGSERSISQSVETFWGGARRAWLADFICAPHRRGARHARARTRASSPSVGRTRPEQVVYFATQIATQRAGTSREETDGERSDAQNVSINWGILGCIGMA